MKNSLVIFFILVLASPFWGTYVYFYFEKNQTRQEVKNKMILGMDKADLIVLSFTEEEIKTRLNWKHSREFEFNGQMYDIVEQHQQGDIIHYTCYKDDKETRLNKAVDRSVAQAMGQDPVQKNKNERLANFFKNLFQPSGNYWNIKADLTGYCQFSILNSQLSIFYPSPPYPPPKQA